MIKTSRQLKDKIKNLTHGDSLKSQTLLRTYMMERFLERLAVSQYNSHFVLKGGMLVSSMVGLQQRATMDIDTTVVALPLTLEDATRTIQEIININLPDGVVFSITNAESIMEEHDYPGLRFTLIGTLDGLRQKVKIDTNLVMPGLDGLRDMAKLMKNLRENPPAEVSGVKVIVRKDYTDGSVIDCVTGAKSRMELSGSNVLRYELEDGTVILVRPSGTEPKIKVYILTQGADAAASNANLEKYGRWVAALKP